MEQEQSYQGALVSLEEVLLSMNNSINRSSKFKFSFYLYSIAYELEYSFHVIIMIYELVYSLYVMILTCSTSCFYIHMTCMSRIRPRVEVAVHRAFGCAHILALSIRRVGVLGGMGSFYVIERGARVHWSRSIHFPFHD